MIVRRLAGVFGVLALCVSPLVAMRTPQSIATQVSVGGVVAGATTSGCTAGSMLTVSATGLVQCNGDFTNPSDSVFGSPSGGWILTASGVQVMELSGSTGVGIAIGDQTVDYLLDMESSGGSAAGVVDRSFSNVRLNLSVPANASYFGGYTQVTSTETADNTANSTHFGAAVYRSSDVAAGRTDSFTAEFRNDARSNVANVEATAGFSYMDAVGAGAMNGTYVGHRIRSCVSTDGSCGTDSAVGILYGLLIEDLQGGASSRRSLNVLGTDDFNFLASSSTVFAASDIAGTWNARVGVVQADGGDLRPAYACRSGASGSNAICLSMGGAADLETALVRIGTAGDYFTGSLAGDSVVALQSTSNRFAFAVGYSTHPEILISDGRTKFTGPDNATVMVSSIAATQANCTTADTFVSFNTNTGQEASVACTAVAGVVAYNTFTGAHFTIVDGKAPPVLTLLESTGVVLRKINGVSSKEQLVESRVCETRGSKSVIGFFAGRNEKDGKDSALAIGTGLAWVANKGVDVEVGDLLISSDQRGAVELQGDSDGEGFLRDDVVRSITVAKARQPVKWGPKEKRRKIAVVYTCG